MEIGREPWWKYALSWISTAAGGFFALGILVSLNNIYDILACVYGAFWFGLPGVWWLWCNRKDKQAWAEFVARQSENVQYAAKIGLPARFNEPVPERQKRHWKIVIVICVVAMVGFYQFLSLNELNM